MYEIGSMIVLVFKMNPIKHMTMSISKNIEIAETEDIGGDYDDSKLQLTCWPDFICGIGIPY